MESTQMFQISVPEWLPVFVNFFASTSDKTDEAANAKRHSKPVKPSVGEKSAKNKYIPPYNKYHTSYDRMVYEILKNEKKWIESTTGEMRGSLTLV
ncbi:unnamed protein product [Caenorhabditis nigoni]